jgi:hypothetical protein
MTVTRNDQNFIMINMMIVVLSASNIDHAPPLSLIAEVFDLKLYKSARSCDGSHDETVRFQIK